MQLDMLDLGMNPAKHAIQDFMQQVTTSTLPPEPWSRELWLFRIDTGFRYSSV